MGDRVWSVRLADVPNSAATTGSSRRPTGHSPRAPWPLVSRRDTFIADGAQNAVAEWYFRFSFRLKSKLQGSFHSPGGSPSKHPPNPVKTATCT